MIGMRSVFATTVVCFALAVTENANAAGFANTHLGGEQGHPTTTNPTALYYNPAGIAFSDGVDIYGDGQLAFRHASWSHTAPQPGPSDQQYSQVGNSGTASLFNVFGGPAVAATMKFGNFAVGAGLFVPFGGRVYWDQNSAFQNPPAGSCGGNGACPLAADGVQRWHIINAQLSFIYTSVGAAYKLGPLALGVTGNFIIEDVKTVQAKTLRGNIDSTAENRGTLDVNKFSGSFAAGAMLEAIRNRLWIGASYQAQPGLGPESLKGTLQYDSGKAPYYLNTGVTHYDASLHESLPDIIRAGVRVRATDRVELRVFGDITRWSVMKSQCVNQANTPAGDSCLVYPDGSTAQGSAAVLANLPRNWNDTYGVRLGGSYWLQPEIELFGGLGFETAAVPDATLEPGAMDAMNFSIAAGGRVKITDYLYLAASYTHVQYLDRTNTSSTLAEKDGNAVQVPTANQDGNGRYTQWIGFLQGSIEAQF